METGIGKSGCKSARYREYGRECLGPKTFAASLDEEAESCGIHILRSRVHMRTANA